MPRQAPHWSSDVFRRVFLPDPKHFGILWMEHEALSTAYDMKGGFNDVSIGLTRGTPVEDVIRRIDILQGRILCSISRKTSQAGSLLLSY